MIQLFQNAFKIRSHKQINRPFFHNSPLPQFPYDYVFIFNKSQFVVNYEGVGSLLLIDFKSETWDRIHWDRSRSSVRWLWSIWMDFIPFFRFKIDDSSINKERTIFYNKPILFVIKLFQNKPFSSSISNILKVHDCALIKSPFLILSKYWRGEFKLILSASISPILINLNFDCGSLPLKVFTKR